MLEDFNISYETLYKLLQADWEAKRRALDALRICSVEWPLLIAPDPQPSQLNDVQTDVQTVLEAARDATDDGDSQS